MLTKFVYCIRTALLNLKKNIILTFISVTTISITFILCISFALIIFNLASFKKSWVDTLQVIVYLKDDSNAAAVEKLQSYIDLYQGVQTVRYVSRKEAMELLKESLQGQDGILEGLSKNPLPASLEVTFREEALSIDLIERFVNDIDGRGPIEDIEYGQKWLERFITIYDIFTISSLTLGICLIVFTYFIIVNTIRLMVYGRRDEIEIMRLVGATNLFIKLPFWLEGMLQGFAGAAVALLFIYAAFMIFIERNIKTLSFFFGSGEIFFLDTSLSCFILLLGALIGLVGSLFSLISLEEFTL